MTERDVLSPPNDVAQTSCLRSMLERRRCRFYFIALMAVFLFGFVYLGYFCPDQVCALTSGPPTPPYKRQSQMSEIINVNPEFGSEALNRNYDFDIDGQDVLVFLHIQKTGGTTFGKHLVKNMDLEKPCICYKDRKRCDCENSKRHMWLFSRYSTGWACGLHADWTELQSCVNDALDKREGSYRKRRYLYLTILREPISRYLSEWRHVRRGATWIGSKLRCNGRQATLEEVPFCFEGISWEGVTLEQFMECPHNLATNRQTRMLANLSRIECYNKSAIPEPARSKIMLQSAKDNLANMAFFGLTEFQKDTQLMFEQTFNLQFVDDFVQYNATHAQDVKISEEAKAKVIAANSLDIELYQYARQLFLHRLQRLREDGLQAGSSTRKNSAGGTRKKLDTAVRYSSEDTASRYHYDDYEEGDENYGNDDYDDEDWRRKVKRRKEDTSHARKRHHRRKSTL